MNPDSDFRRSKVLDSDMPPMGNEMPPVKSPRPGAAGGTSRPMGGGDKDLFLPGNESRKPAIDDLQPVPKSGTGTDNPGGREYNDRNGGVRIPGPLLNLDAKITWRAVPERTRVKVRTGITAPVVARQSTPMDTNSEWQPAGVSTKIVRK